MSTAVVIVCVFTALAAAAAEFGRPSARSPLFVLGWDQCGTSTIAEFFTCGGYKTARSTCGYRNQPCADCIRSNIRQRKKKSMLHGCGDYEVYTRIDMFEPPNYCYRLQFAGIDIIHKHLPNSTWLLNMRPVRHWLNSIKTSGSGSSMIEGMLGCGDLPNRTDDAVIWAYYNQIDFIRKFWSQHKSHPYLEIDVESPHTAHIMSRHFGIVESCWQTADTELGDQLRSPDDTDAQFLK